MGWAPLRLWRRRAGRRRACGAGRRGMAEGVNGLLRDKTCPLGIAPLETMLVDKVVALTLEPPAQEVTHWTVRAMAKAVGIAASSAVKIWHDHGLPCPNNTGMLVQQFRPIA